jgi:hypothetical protein
MPDVKSAPPPRGLNQTRRFKIKADLSGHYVVLARSPLIDRAPYFRDWNVTRKSGLPAGDRYGSKRDLRFASAPGPDRTYTACERGGRPASVGK